MLTSTQAGLALGISSSRIRQLCLAGRIQGALRHGRDWLIPEDFKVIAVPMGRPRKGEPAPKGARSEKEGN